jgi:hypothetical protein
VLAGPSGSMEPCGVRHGTKPNPAAFPGKRGVAERGTRPQV